MIKIYQAANGVDAHLVLNLLQQAGLNARVDGEYLQGGMGDLQVSGLVNVVVDESGYEQAREIVEKWNTKEPIEINNDKPFLNHNELAKDSLTIKPRYFIALTLLLFIASLIIYDATKPISICFPGAITVATPLDPIFEAKQNEHNLPKQ